MAPERWVITAKLTATSPLSIASGEVDVERINKTEADNRNKEKDEHGTAMAPTAANGRPFIPGATLRGLLRHWMSRQPEADGVATRLFGPEKGNSGDDTPSGLVRVFDALMTKLPDTAKNLPHGDEKRGTYVQAHTAIDRHLGTVLDRHLFHREIIAPKAEFGLRLEAKGLREEEVGWLCAALDRFADDPALRVGGEVVDGFGQVTASDIEVRRLTAEKLHEWLAAGGKTHWTTALVKETRFKNWKPAMQAESRMAWPFVIQSLGPFAVNTGIRHDAGKDAERANNQPFRDADNRIQLPASSLRGALRTRAEKILRSLERQHCTGIGPGSCPPITTLEERDRLCPACRLFGAAGWRSPLRFPKQMVGRTERSTDTQRALQEHIAIDRFTGGGVDGLKFRLEYAVNPVFGGALIIENDRLESEDLGLLVLVLRDLADGLIPLGAGANRGHGRVRAFFGTSAVPANPDEASAWGALDRNLLSGWVNAFRNSGQMVAMEEELCDGQ